MPGEQRPDRDPKNFVLPELGQLLQRSRLEGIRDNLVARIAEAEREGWLGEVEGLRVSLAGAEDQLVQMDRRTPGGTAIDLGMPRMVPAQPIREEGTASLRESLDDQQ
ncbi:hypothetical protein [Streptomyces endocoffeicus]|uniref:hypothetical protein n=1 Tax=Streptomyces endocoffeicus TaxID=2898945 RepID=UPI001E373B98|nr:hypothetical protein [Streptomyces endocoffeicus]